MYRKRYNSIRYTRILRGRLDNNEALFINKNGTRLLEGCVRIMFKKLGRETGIKKVHPNKFRRMTESSYCKYI